MIAQPATPSGIVLLCDAQGRIRDVLRDDLGIAETVAAGTLLTSAVRRADVAKALSFLAELRAHGIALGPQIGIAVANRAIAVTWAGTRAGDCWLILMSPSSLGLRCLCEEMALEPNETVAAACQHLIAQAGSMGSWTPSEMQLFDEITRLNNELINVRRQLESRVARQKIELKTSDQRFRAIFQQTRLGIALADLRGKVLDVNPAMEQMLSAQGTSWQDRTFLELFGISDTPTTLAELDRELLLGLRQEYRTQQRCIRTEGTEAWLLISGAVVKDEAARPAFLLYIVDDITGRRQAETALLHAEKLSITGRLAASLAHEINNPLQSVIGFIGLAREAPGESESIERYLHMAMQELRRVSHIVGRLRDLNLPSRLEEPQPTDLGGILQRVISLTSQQCATRRVECSFKLEQDLPPVAVVPDRLQQVFLNLVLNALDAMPDGGRLHMVVTRTDSPLGIEVSFEDTGGGMPEQVLEKVFDPFYSTKPDGLGLGLFISRDIVDQYGGRISAESRPGEGSRFAVWLPA